jgi:hypothetical protein
MWGGDKTAEDRSHLDPGLTGRGPQPPKAPHDLNLADGDLQLSTKNPELASTSSKSRTTPPLGRPLSHSLLFFTCDETLSASPSDVTGVPAI